ILDRAPHRLQENALLRIHHLGFTRRDTEEQRVELVDLFHEAAPARVGLVHFLYRVAIIGFPDPAITRDVRHQVAPVPERFPENVEILGLWHDAADADDGYRHVGKTARARHPIPDGCRDGGAHASVFDATALVYRQVSRTRLDRIHGHRCRARRGEMTPA